MATIGLLIVIDNLVRWDLLQQHFMRICDAFQKFNLAVA